MARNANSFAKRQREMEKKRKAEEKRRRREERRAGVESATEAKPAEDEVEG